MISGFGFSRLADRSGRVHRQFAADIVRNRRGATMVEYALLVALIAIISIAAVTAVGQNTECIYAKVANALIAVTGGDPIECSIAGAASPTSTGANTCDHPVFGLMAEGDTVTAWQAQTVPNGDTCTSEVRTCTGGVLTGSFTATECGQACNGPGNVVLAHNESRDFFTAEILACPASSCNAVAETRTCNDGVLSGSAGFASCTAPGPCEGNWTALPTLCSPIGQIFPQCVGPQLTSFSGGTPCAPLGANAVEAGCSGVGPCTQLACQ